MFKTKALADCQGLSFDIVFDMVLSQNILMLAVDILIAASNDFLRVPPPIITRILKCSGTGGENFFQ